MSKETQSSRSPEAAGYETAVDAAIGYFVDKDGPRCAAYNAAFGESLGREVLRLREVERREKWCEANANDHVIYPPTDEQSWVVWLPRLDEWHTGATRSQALDAAIESHNNKLTARVSGKAANV